MKPIPTIVLKKAFKKISFLFSLLFVLCFSCKTPSPATKTKETTIVFKIVQMNDVYEIAPLSGGKYGGLARVAHVVDSIKAENPNTFLVMAGDFLNPSLLGTIKVDGETIRGKHMIDVMNAMEVDLATFGNHEFDLKPDDLQKRLNESEFAWTSANVFQQTKEGPMSFYTIKDGDSIRIPDTYTFQIKKADTTALTVGLFSVTIDSNPQDYVFYSDYLVEANTAFLTLEAQKTDVILGLTHLTLEQDTKVANALPQIPLLMGGHEHNHMLVSVHNTNIVKADANAKTVYVHTFTYPLNTKKLNIVSELVPITDKTASSPKVKAVVDSWNSILDEKIKEVISNPYEVIYKAIPPLDGTDSANRSTQTNLGQLITKGMAYAYKDDVDLVFVNGGSFRLDDRLEGDVTSLDIFRVLPFGGSIYTIKLKGSLLKKVLDYGESHTGTGAYLHRMSVAKESNDGPWLLKGSPIGDEIIYTAAISDFLLKGFDIPFLTPENEGIIAIYKPSESEMAGDIRKAVINYLKDEQ
ncbi:bifunctional metallophosphatase/5'-nucleotidase [Rasiella sp. SM2506]|uniref:bifunctional metallophosphatase/5'-nucleotidase n=1 Tax=Rasiella sp. SM2506 TaxID=3423914 RepID=UPI003D79A51F